MGRIKMTMGFDSETFGIAKLVEKEGTKLVGSSMERNTLPSSISTQTEPKSELKLWDDYTGKELAELKKNRRATYISLYFLKYGIEPPKYLGV